MKAKFVRVWDQRRFGSIPFIVLQVEETDTFLTKANFNPGYKFVIQALYNRVGAAGGHEFNPYYYHEGVREKSQNIDTNEADALGFYLGNIKNIHDMPENLYTEKFWDAVWTSRNIKDEKYNGDEDYYKLLLTTGCRSMATLIDNLEFGLNGLQSEEFPFYEKTAEMAEQLIASINKTRKKYERNGWDINEEKQVVRCVVVDKKDLSVINSGWSTDNDSTIADYLWLPFEEMPYDVFRKFADVNDDYGGLQILDLEEYS